MATAADRKILLKTNRKKQKHIEGGCCCSICGKKLKFKGMSDEYPLTCWQCMIVNVDSKNSTYESRKLANLVPLSLCVLSDDYYKSRQACYLVK